MMVALFVSSATFAQKPAFTDKVDSKYEISDEEALKNLLYESYDDLTYQQLTNPTDEFGNPVILGNPTAAQTAKMEADIRAKEMSYSGWTPNNDAEAKVHEAKLAEDEKYRMAGYWPRPDGFVLTGNEDYDLPNYLDLRAKQLKAELDMAEEGYKPIPGFKFTGNSAIDDAAYATAMADLKKYDPVTYDKFFN